MIILNPILSVVGLVVTAINITEFFLLVRLILIWKEVPLLRAFDNAGHALTDRITDITDEMFIKCRHQKLTSKSNIVLTLLALEVIRLLLAYCVFSH